MWVPGKHNFVKKVNTKSTEPTSKCIPQVKKKERKKTRRKKTQNATGGGILVAGDNIFLLKTYFCGIIVLSFYVIIKLVFFKKFYMAGIVGS